MRLAQVLRSRTDHPGLGDTTRARSRSGQPPPMTSRHAPTLGRRIRTARRRRASAPRQDSWPLGWPGRAPGLVRQRLAADSGARSGEVTTDSAVLWGRASGRGRMAVRLDEQRTAAAHGARPLGRRAHRPHRAAAAGRPGARPAVRRHDLVHLRRRRDRPDRAGQLQHRADPRGAELVGVVGRHLRPGLGDQRGARRADDVRRDASRPSPTSSSTAATRSTPTSRSRSSVQEDSGHVWRNLVTEEVDEGGRDARRVPRPAPLPLLDSNVRALYAEVPDDRAVGRPRDHATTGTRASSSTTTATPSAAATCWPPAAAGPGRSTSRCRSARFVDRGGDGFASGADLPPGPARRSTSTCSASTCAPTAAPTTPSPAPSQPGHPRAGPGGAG